MQIVPHRPFRDYWVHREIASGGMSVVYLAFDPAQARFVALKTLLEELWDEPDHRARFRREIRVQRQLNHPNIVRFLGGEASPDGCFLATEYLRGLSLDRVLRRSGRPLEVPEVVRLLEGLTAALFHSHSKQIIHRDIQPRNVILEDTGGVRLFDFGIALTPDDLIDTKTGVVMGTFAYSSPEQNQGRKVDERSDLYSLGLVIYELLTGTRAIQGTTLVEITEFQLRRTIPPPGVLRHGVPPALSDLVHRMVQRWIEDRPRSARHVLDELIQLKATASVQERELLSPDPVQALLDVARRVLHGGRPVQALERAQRALASSPDHGPSHMLLGKIYAELGDTGGMEEAFLAARAAEPDDPDAVLSQALGLYAHGHPERAHELAQYCLDRYGTNPLASCLLTFLEAGGPAGTGLPGPRPQPLARPPVLAPVDSPPEIPAASPAPAPAPAPEAPRPPASIGQVSGVPPGPATPPAIASVVSPPREPAHAPLPSPQAALETSGIHLIDPSISSAELDLQAFRDQAAPPRPRPPSPDDTAIRGPDDKASPGSRHGPPTTAAGSMGPVEAVRSWQKRMRRRSPMLVAIAALLFPGLGPVLLGRWREGFSLLIRGAALLVSLVALAAHPALRRRSPGELLPAGIEQLAPSLGVGVADPYLFLGWLVGVITLLYLFYETWEYSRRETARLHAAALSPARVECAYIRDGHVVLVTQGYPGRLEEEYVVLSAGEDPRKAGRYMGDARCTEAGAARSIHRFVFAFEDDEALAGAVLLPRDALGPSRLL